MPRFIIEENVTYEVEAEDAEAALDIFLDSDDPNEFFVSVEEREVYAG